MPGRTFKVGRIAGIPVGISPWWLAIAALFTWSLGSSYFPAEVKRISPLASYGLGLRVSCCCSRASSLTSSVTRSVNASTIGLALVLASGEHPRRSVLEFALGVIAVFLGGALIPVGPGRVPRALEPHPSLTVRYIVETVVGVAMWS